jgi:hypothetical protein
MIHLPRRYFFQARNEKHYNKEKKMGGYTNLDGVSDGWIRGEVPLRHTVQEAIDGLNAATTRLDNLIREMQGNCECKN